MQAVKEANSDSVAELGRYMALYANQEQINSGADLVEVYCVS